MMHDDSKHHHHPPSHYSSSSPNYLENPFYQRAPTESKDDRELIQQGLLPPSPLVQISSHSRSYYSSPIPTKTPQSNTTTISYYTQSNGGGAASQGGGGLPGRPRRRNPSRNTASSSTQSAAAYNTDGASSTGNRRGRDGKGGDGFTGLWRAIPLIGRIFSSSSSSSSTPVHATKLTTSTTTTTAKSPNMGALSGNASNGIRPPTTKTRKRRPFNQNNNVSTHSIGSSSSTHRTTTSTFSFLHMANHLQLPAAIMTWYILGIVSISTTKILLRDWGDYGVSPLLLTVQQFCIGVTFLRIWIQLKHHAPPRPVSFGKVFSRFSNKQQPQQQTNMKFNHRNTNQSKSSNSNNSTAELHLLLSAICFTLGFLITNQSFFNSDASFVETIKASEPLSSATIAVLWGIERLSPMEAGSLLSISGGVILATLGNVHSTTMGMTTLAQSMSSSGTVLLSNLCFSFRGLYQKLFRASSSSSSSSSSSVGGSGLGGMDDLNLQFRMQMVGIWILIVPLVVLDVRPFVGAVMVEGGWGSGGGGVVGVGSGGFVRYVGLAMVNGFAFTHYNLASTYILSRISVVHHAALNCIRRLFAIIVTSIIFGVQITLLSGLGIIVSIAGFMAFTHYKTQRIKTPRPLSSLLPLSE